MAAFAAPLDVAAERRGAATLDRGHGAASRAGQRRAMPVTKRRAELAEHVRQFQPLAGQGGRSDRTRSGVAELTACRVSSGLAVAQTELVAIRRY